MNTARFVFAVICLPLALSAQDSTAAARGDQTLAQRVGLRGLHLSLGSAAGPYMGRNGSAGHGRNPCRCHVPTLAGVDARDCG